MKDELEKEMSFRGFIDWKCPSWLDEIPNTTFNEKLMIAIDIECGIDKETAIGMALNTLWEPEE